MDMNTQKKYEFLLDLLKNKADKMFCEAKGFLKYPYLDPGGVYSGNLWDWDSFWAATALLGIADIIGDKEFKRQVSPYARGSLLNFFEVQNEEGAVPILMSDKNIDYFDSLSVRTNNMAKPVLGQFALLLYEHGLIDEQLMEEILVKLKKFYDCYKQRYLHQATGLYVWANDIAIGVDDDPATWGRPAFSSASIYLNCFLYKDLESAGKLAEKIANTVLQDTFNKAKDDLKKAINKYCKDDIDSLYYSADVLCKQNLVKNRTFGTLNINAEPFWNCIPVKIASWSSFLVMFCHITDKDFADKMLQKHLLNPNRFWSEYGIRTLACNEKMYTPDKARGNPSNWLGPVWIVSNYLVWKGLVDYGYKKEAEELAGNTIELLSKSIEEKGFMYENYNPETGEGIAAENFLNWNLLVCLMN